MTFNLESRAAGRSSRFAEPLIKARGPLRLFFVEKHFAHLPHITGTQRQQHIAGLQGLF